MNLANYLIPAGCSVGRHDSFGNAVVVYKGEPDFQIPASTKVAIIGVPEDRFTDGAGEIKSPGVIRRQLYALSAGTQGTVVDLGNFRTGKTLIDTYYGLKDIVSELYEQNIVTLLIGGTLDVFYGNCLAVKDQNVTLTTVAPRLRFPERDDTKHPINALVFCQPDPRSIRYPISDNPISDNPTIYDYPISDCPISDNPISDNPTSEIGKSHIGKSENRISHIEQSEIGQSENRISHIGQSEIGQSEIGQSEIGKSNNRISIHICNFGYQSYYVSQQDLDEFSDRHFEAYRLGEIRDNLRESEPVIRDSDLLAISMDAVKYSDAPAASNASPNGFTGEEICQVAFFAGLSHRCRSLGIFDIIPQNDVRDITSKLAAQMAWYFVEGVKKRNPDSPHDHIHNFKKYLIYFDQLHHNLCFFKNIQTERWWMEIPSIASNDDSVIISCTQEDYMKAAEQEIPDRWWKTYQRIN